MRDIIGKAFVGCLILGGIAFVVWMAAFMMLSVTTEARCLEAGWAKASVTYNLRRFCIREENEYEITKPLWRVEREAQ